MPNRDETTMLPCNYCYKSAELVTGREIYPHRLDLHDKRFYRCVPCGAIVGCHPGTTRALGRLANAELRKARMAAHAAFDPLWRSGRMTRGAAYKWLAARLGVDGGLCHIGEFELKICQRLVTLCNGASRSGLPINADHEYAQPDPP